MEELIKLIIGIFVLALGFPIGSYLARITNEELKSGQKWFKLIIIICGIGAVGSLIFGKDIYLYSFLFVLIVTSRSLRKD